MLQSSWVVPLIILFPLLGFLVNALFIRNGRTAGIVASAAVVLSFVAALVAIGVLQGQPEDAKRLDVVLWEWISVGSFRVPFGLLFDPLTAVMALLVTGVGAIIHIYSVGYMHGDVRPVRFFAAMNLFIVAMLFLIMSDNILLLFLGWEGVGLCSFLLIGHYFERNVVQPDINPAGAAMKAFVANRVGDVGMLLAMMAIFSQLGTLTFYSQLAPDGSVLNPGFLERINDVGFNQISLGIFGSVGVASAISVLLLLGVAGKSAQFPLYVWLPDAMAGPTPVSALIHAATMVTSGIYLIARTHTVFAAAEGWASGLVIAVGILTVLIGATAAVTQFDIKRVLAYSTISQLGYMLVAVGMGAIGAGMFHLLTHGIFKALLFLAAGSVIHGAHDIQDMRRMGGLRKAMPITYATYLVGALALSGIVPFAGFWSKDEIIGHAFAIGNNFTGVLLIIASMFTAFYMGRQIALIFFDRQRDTSYQPHESGSILTTPLIILTVGTVFGGLINFPGLHWLVDYLQPVINEEAETFNIGLAVITTLLSLASGYAGWWLYAHVLTDSIRPGKEDPAYYYSGDLWRGSELAWGLDWLYTHAVVRPYQVTATFLSDVFDRQGIDGILVDGTGSAFGRLSQSLRTIQNGYVRSYVVVFLLGVVVLVGYFAFQ